MDKIKQIVQRIIPILLKIRELPIVSRILICVVVIILTAILLFSCHAQRRASRTTYRQIVTNSFDTIRTDYYIHKDSRSFNQSNIDHNVLHNEIKTE